MTEEGKDPSRVSRRETLDRMLFEAEVEAAALRIIPEGDMSQFARSHTGKSDSRIHRRRAERLDLQRAELRMRELEEEVSSLRTDSRYVDTLLVRKYLAELDAVHTMDLSEENQVLRNEITALKKSHDAEIQVKVSHLARLEKRMEDLGPASDRLKSLEAENTLLQEKLKELEAAKSDEDEIGRLKEANVAEKAQFENLKEMWKQAIATLKSENAKLISANEGLARDNRELRALVKSSTAVKPMGASSSPVAAAAAAAEETSAVKHASAHSSPTHSSRHTKPAPAARGFSPMRSGAFFGGPEPDPYASDKLNMEDLGLPSGASGRDEPAPSPRRVSRTPPPPIAIDVPTPSRSPMHSYPEANVSAVSSMKASHMSLGSSMGPSSGAPTTVSRTIRAPSRAPPPPPAGARTRGVASAAAPYSRVSPVVNTGAHPVSSTFAGSALGGGATAASRLKQTYAVESPLARYTGVPYRSAPAPLQ